MTSPLTVACVHVVGGLDVDEAGGVPLTHDGPEALVLRVDGQRARILAEVLCKLIDHTSVLCKLRDHTFVLCKLRDHTSVLCKLIDHTSVLCKLIDHTSVLCKLIDHTSVLCKLKTTFQYCVN